MLGGIKFEVRQNMLLISNSLHGIRHFCFDANPCAIGRRGLRRNRNVWAVASSDLSHLQLEFTLPNNSLQATRDGASSSASRAYSPVGPRTFTGFTLVGPACLSSGRWAKDYDILRIT
jgi:hypothetical protein